MGSKMYPLGDYVPYIFPRPFTVYSQNYRAEETGEFRPPKKGEWYISGAIPEAYLAKSDLISKYHIARIFKVRHIEYWEEIDD